MLKRKRNCISIKFFTVIFYDDGQAAYFTVHRLAILCLTMIVFFIEM